MKKIVNTLTITKEAQGNNYSKVIGDTILLLLSEGNIVSVKQELSDFVIIEYSHDNNIDYWGTPCLEWLEDGEVEALEDYRFRKEAINLNDEDIDDKENENA